MLQIYRIAAKVSEPALNYLLERRARKGKELEARLDERKGLSPKERPKGPVLWVHAASVGEAQSALILIDHLLALHESISVILTSGTVTSAKVMAEKLPERAFHQFYPLDHPAWVGRFLDHWQPNMAFWMESEIWPNMLEAIKSRNIPAGLINARLSEKSYKKWKLFRHSAKHLLGAFSAILAQTPEDAEKFKNLGATGVIETGNLKFSAKALPFDKEDLNLLKGIIGTRRVWVFASTHEGEEELACRVHERLKENIPELLTIIVPRHPERRAKIKTACNEFRLVTVFRGTDRLLPDEDTDIYVADTMGELGLFYRLCPVACIGRSFSDDGGGGHNPIEAAQLHCAVLHGPNVQFQQAIFDEMDIAGGAYVLRDEGELVSTLFLMFNNPEEMEEAQGFAYSLAQEKTAVIDVIMENLDPLIQEHIFEAEEKRLKAS